MPPTRITLPVEDVEAVAAKIEEVSPPATRNKIAAAFDISPSTLSKVAERDGWLERLREMTTQTRIRSVDEALKAVSDLVA